MTLTKDIGDICLALSAILSFIAVLNEYKLWELIIEYGKPAYILIGNKIYKFILFDVPTLLLISSILVIIERFTWFIERVKGRC